jgi:carbonic anhydrase/acetyltransferase-like protein (isoleucine patch superfamily)
VKIFVSLGWNKLNAERRYLYERLKSEGFQFANLISPLAVIRGKVEGDNCWINDYTVIQSDACIKSDVTVREGVIIGNGTVINEHCFISVNAVIGGGSSIGEQTFVGMRGTVFDGTKVGEKCLVGACAIVKRNLKDYSVCKTTLNSCEIKQYDENTIEQKLIASKNVR